MKNFNRVNRAIMAKTNFCKSLFLILAILTIGVGQMWGAQRYKITGSNTNLTGWGTWQNMTVSSDGFYEYFIAASGDCKFKINTSASWDGAMGEYYNTPGFNSTNVGNGAGSTWTDGDHNANYWYGGTYYILIYYANTTASDPIICAATYLPYNASYRQYFVNTSSWSTPLKAYAWYYQNSTAGSNNASWPGSAMTSTGKTLNGKTIYYIDLTQVYDQIIFNYNGADATKTSDLSLGTTNKGKMWDGDSWETYQFDITLDQQSGSGGTSSVIGVVGSAMPGSKTAPSRTGYDFVATIQALVVAAHATTMLRWSANKLFLPARQIRFMPSGQRKHLP